jgi:hypothetical protein
MFEELQKELEKEIGSPTSSGDSDWYNLKEGDNKMRLASVGALYAQYYDKAKNKFFVAVGEDMGCPYAKAKEKPSIKYLTWAVIGGELKLVKLPYKAYKGLVSLQQSDDWGFQNFPMEYDINLKVKGAGTKEVEYSIIPSPKKSEIDSDLLADLEEKSTALEIVNKMKDKRIKELGGEQAESLDYPENDLGEPAF